VDDYKGNDYLFLKLQENQFKSSSGTHFHLKNEQNFKFHLLTNSIIKIRKDNPQQEKSQKDTKIDSFACLKSKLYYKVLTFKN